MAGDFYLPTWLYMVYVIVMANPTCSVLKRSHNHEYKYTLTQSDQQ